MFEDDAEEYSMLSKDTNKSDLESGCGYVGIVSRISNNGHGLVQLDDGHILLGKMDEEAVGKEIKFTYKGSHYGVCESEYVKKTQDHTVDRVEDEDEDLGNKNDLLNGKL